MKKLVITIIIMLFFKTQIWIPPDYSLSFQVWLTYVSWGLRLGQFFSLGYELRIERRQSKIIWYKVDLLVDDILELERFWGAPFDT